jgi:hypothetical protein
MSRDFFFTLSMFHLSHIWFNLPLLDDMMMVVGYDNSFNSQRVLMAIILAVTKCNAIFIYMIVS